MGQCIHLTRRFRTAAVLTLLAGLVAAPGPAGGPAAPPAAAVIAVEVPASPAAPAEPCADGARLVRLEAGRLSLLAPGFTAACDPALDAGASHLYFAGRRRADGPWAVWELDLDTTGREARRLTPEQAGCRSPAPLPGGSVAVVCGGARARVDRGGRPGSRQRAAVRDTA